MVNVVVISVRVVAATREEKLLDYSCRDTIPGI